MEAVQKRTACLPLAPPRHGACSRCHRRHQGRCFRPFPRNSHRTPSTAVHNASLASTPPVLVLGATLTTLTAYANTPRNICLVGVNNRTCSILALHVGMQGSTVMYTTMAMHDNEYNAPPLTRSYIEKHLLSAQPLEVFLVGVGTALRLERDPWPMVKRVLYGKQQMSTPPSPVYTTLIGWLGVGWRRRCKTRLS